jgi:hypothetical protein
MFDETRGAWQAAYRRREPARWERAMAELGYGERDLAA